MVRTLEFDVSRWRSRPIDRQGHGKPFTALPIFVMRQFHHAPIAYK